MSRQRPSIAELKKRYLESGKPLGPEAEAELRADPRVGAAAILAAIEKRRHANRSEGQRLRRMLEFERELWAEGIQRVGGVDEAGMSPLAGPVVAAAVILPVNARLNGVDDSKKLDAETREVLAAEIKRAAIAWSIGVSEPEEIDRLNIYHAGLLAMHRAVQRLEPAPEAILVDARRIPDLPMRQRAIVKGDAKSLTIAAASILAKTTRDRIMVELDRQWPGYGLAHHKGYPVATHLDALARMGACPAHRRSFTPVRKALGLEPVQTELFPDGGGD